MTTVAPGRPTWSTACPDWEQRLLAGTSLVPIPPLFPDQAAKALEIFKGLRVPDIAGRPTFGEVAAPFVLDLVGAIFGAYDAETGQRLINQAMLLISKKNGKSTIAAGIMLTALVLNWRHEQGMSILAPTIEVAHNSFDPAAAMVRMDPELETIIHVRDHLRTLEHRTTGAELRVIAADADVTAGSKDGFVLVDELWLFGKRAKAKAMLDEATGGLVSRPEGFVLYLTTHSDEAPAGVYAEKLRYARAVRDGEIADPKFLPMLYEWPKAMLDDQAYLQPEFFYVTNPNLGRSVSAEWLTGRLAEEQQSTNKGSLQLFLAKHLNVEIGMRLGGRHWAGADLWQRAEDPGLTLEEILRRSEVAVVGIDGGGLDDLLALGLIGRDRETRDWLFWAHAWAHPAVLERRKEIAPRLLDLQAAGEVTICTEPTQDVAELAAIVERLHKAGLLPDRHGIGLDPFGVTAIVDEIAARGIADEVMVPIGQGVRLSPAVWGAERKLNDGTFRHGGQPLMAWAIGNAVAEQRGNAVIITKETAGKAKIDPLIAMFNAVLLMSRNPVAVGGGDVAYAFA
jgi:phage terminase large subunit-like protein